jgi:poly(3-hydroxybutyrate) depolymerase
MNIRYVFFFIILLVSLPVMGEPIKQGNAKYSVDLQGTSLNVFTYKPNCPVKSILFVFHGNARNAKTYRNAARSLGDHLCMLVVAPLFDAKRFPGWRYQRGGIFYHGVLQNPNTWTAQFVLQLVKWVREKEGRSLSFSLIGHSAGSQFLSRLAAFTPTDATRIVIANPSTYVFADLNIKAPYGFGGVYPAKNAEAELKRYLALPVTIFLGESDVTNKALNQSAAALSQGKKRYDRGLNAFHSAERLAKSHGWIFNWQLVVVPNVGHSAIKMFSSPLAKKALGS